VDLATGEEVPLEFFVRVLRAIGLLYAEATRSQDLASWVTAPRPHAGVLPGQCRDLGARQSEERRHAGARVRAARQSTYEELAHHYGAVVIPTHVARPKDKPKAEVCVQIAQRWILAALRHQTFFALADLNAAIRARVDAINHRPMKGVGVSRRVLFAQLDRPALAIDDWLLAPLTDAEPARSP
jgi:transposase